MSEKPKHIPIPARTTDGKSIRIMFTAIVVCGLVILYSPYFSEAADVDLGDTVLADAVHYSVAVRIIQSCCVAAALPMAVDMILDCGKKSCDHLFYE